MLSLDLQTVLTVLVLWRIFRGSKTVEWCMLWRIRWDIFTSFTVYITHDRTETVTSAQHLHNYSKLGILILCFNVSFLPFPWCLNVKTIA